MSVKRLSSQEIEQKLKALPSWKLNGALKLEKEFLFEDFREAFAFMTHTALIAEAMNHHPEWYNVYNRLKIELTTHDAGGISDLDFQFADALEELSAR